MRRLSAGLNTIIGRLEAVLAILECVLQAGVPSLVRLKCDLKTEPAVGGNSLARGALHRSRQCAAKVAVRIFGANLLSPLRPLRRDLAAAHNVTRLDLKDVREVASKSYLKLKTHRFHAVVGDVQVFMQAALE